MIHLAMAVVSDLGLNKNVQERTMGTFGTLRYFRPPERQIPKRSLDERRAFLGTFYVSTMYVTADKFATRTTIKANCSPTQGIGERA